MKKKIIIYFVIGLFALIGIIILLIFVTNKLNKSSVNSSSKYFGDIYRGSILDSNYETVSNDELSESHCVNGICISDLVINCTKNYGVIRYKITNNGNNDNNYGLINFGNNKLKAYINIDDVGQNESKTKYFRYRNYDLTDVTNYTFIVLNDSYKNMFAN